MFRLQGCSEDDTIFLLKRGISSDILQDRSVRQYRAVFYVKLTICLLMYKSFLL